MIKTSKTDIKNYWNALKPDNNLTATTCWRCGIKKRLDRCHIVAHSNEGRDEPQNFVLLCKHCHIDSPNTHDPVYMWEWLDYYRKRPYKDLWFFLGVMEYERVFNTSFEQDIKDKQLIFKEAFDNAIKTVPRHFGQPSINASSVAGIIHEVIGRI